MEPGISCRNYYLGSLLSGHSVSENSFEGFHCEWRGTAVLKDELHGALTQDSSLFLIVQQLRESTGYQLNYIFVGHQRQLYKRACAANVDTMSRKFSVFGPVTIQAPTAAGSRILCPPTVAILPPTKTIALRGIRF